MWHGVAGWLLPVARSAVPAGTYTGEAANLRVVEGAGGCSGQNTRWAKGTKPSFDCAGLGYPAQRDLCVKRMLSARAPLLMKLEEGVRGHVATGNQMRGHRDGRREPWRSVAREAERWCGWAVCGGWGAYTHGRWTAA